MPVVVVDREIPGVSVDEVLTDNARGGWLATRHLLDLGHRRIGCIPGPSDVTPSADRVTGYRQALDESGVPVDEALKNSPDRVRDFFAVPPILEESAGGP